MQILVLLAEDGQVINLSQVAEVVSNLILPTIFSITCNNTQGSAFCF